MYLILLIIIFLYLFYILPFTMPFSLLSYSPANHCACSCVRMCISSAAVAIAVAIAVASASAVAMYIGCVVPVTHSSWSICIVMSFEIRQSGDSTRNKLHHAADSYSATPASCPAHTPTAPCTVVSTK